MVRRWFFSSVQAHSPLRRYTRVLTLPAAANALSDHLSTGVKRSEVQRCLFFFFKQGRWARFGLSRPKPSWWPSQTVLIRTWLLPTAGEHIWDGILAASAAGLGNSASLGIRREPKQVILSFFPPHTKTQKRAAIRLRTTQSKGSSPRELARY